jgi:hypothetical protein
MYYKLKIIQEIINENGYIYYKKALVPCFISLQLNNIVNGIYYSIIQKMPPPVEFRMRKLYW